MGFPQTGSPSLNSSNMLHPLLPVNSAQLQNTFTGKSVYSREDDYTDSIRIFRQAFQRLMNQEFLSKCCDDLHIQFEDAKGELIKRNPSSNDNVHIHAGEESGVFRITRAIYRSQVALETEWYQLRAEQTGGSSSHPNVISIFFNEPPEVFTITLMREGKHVYLRIEAPEKLIAKDDIQELCDRILSF